MMYELLHSSLVEDFSCNLQLPGSRCGQGRWFFFHISSTIEKKLKEEKKERKKKATPRDPLRDLKSNFKNPYLDYSLEGSNFV